MLRALPASLRGGSSTTTRSLLMTRELTTTTTATASATLLSPLHALRTPTLAQSVRCVGSGLCSGVSGVSVGLPRWMSTDVAADGVETDTGGSEIPSSSKSSSSEDATNEIKDAAMINELVWSKIKRPRHELVFPKEIIFLGGAPGAGKGTNTPFILEARGITSSPIVMSDLLDSPKFRQIKAEGNMIGDSEVFLELIEELLKDEYQTGAVVDGFPRTKVQVELAKMLHARMMELWRDFKDTQYSSRFRRPKFRVCVLFIEEKESVQRQLNRGRLIKAHNEIVRETGEGELMEERPTDNDEELVRHRYGVFKQHYPALKELQKTFPFHLINAQGAIEAVQANIMKQLEYQSSLELGEETYAIINDIPEPSALTMHARQNLIRRLGLYQRNHEGLFKQVANCISSEFQSVLQRHSLSGYCVVRPKNPVFDESISIDMCIDILSERGYIVSHNEQEIPVPWSTDIDTGRITCKPQVMHEFVVKFKPGKLRRSQK